MSVMAVEIPPCHRHDQLAHASLQFRSQFLYTVTMRALLKAAGRTLSVTAAAAALLTLIRPRQAWFRLLLWRPKLLTAAFSPLLLLAGSLGLLLGRLFRDPEFLEKC